MGMLGASCDLLGWYKLPTSPATSKGIQSSIAYYILCLFLKIIFSSKVRSYTIEFGSKGKDITDTSHKRWSVDDKR